MSPAIPWVEVIQTSPYRKELVHRGPHDIEAWLDGQFVAGFCTPAQAIAELDRVAYEDAIRHGARPASDDARLTPFGVMGGPLSDTPISRAALRAAFVRFCRAYDGNDAVLSRAERALQIEPEQVTIHEAGDITIRGSSGTYRVTATECRCKDFWVRDSAHAGMCKHMIRRELLRLAQELTRAGLVESVDLTEAYTAIAPDDLGRLKAALDRALRLAAAGEPADTTVIIVNRLLLLQQGSATIARLTGVDGDGVSHARLTLASIHDARTALKHSMARDPRPAVQVFLTAGDVMLLERAVVFSSRAA
jgi:hypothetical protein